MIYQVLIVDDEEIVCRGLKEFVKWADHGFEVAGIAYSVDEALSILEKNYIDVVFTDITMPGKSGLDLLKALSQANKDLKTVIFSGYSDFQFAQEALRYGAVDYLTKPVNLKELENLLDKLHREIDQQARNAEIQKKRTEILLLSMARGHVPYSRELYQIPEIGNWYGLSLGMRNSSRERNLEARMESFRKKLSAVFVRSIVLPYEATKLFLILPCESAQALNCVISLLESLFQENEVWACGISSPKTGLGKIAEAFYEAGQALRYLFARQRGDFLPFENIESLYESNASDILGFIQKILCLLTDPSTRDQVKQAASEQLFLKFRNNGNLEELQLFCIQALIEMKGSLQNVEIENNSSMLNNALVSIMHCGRYEELESAVTTYIGSLAAAFNKKADSQLGIGAIREIQIYMNQHFAENITLQNLAEQFFFHPNYLSRLFKEKTGENFTEHLTRIRVNKVKELLDSTDYKISEICEMVGYDNPRYLSKVFKQYVGMTPREYRERT